jgi:elongation factor Ts
MEQCLLDQTFIKDDKKNVAQYVATYGDVAVSSFKRVTLE